MPSKSPAKATLEIQKEHEARWQYLIRNTEFRKHIRELRRVYQNHHERMNYVEMRKAFLRKWELMDIPVEILSHEKHSVVPEERMHFYASFKRKAPFRYPIEAMDAIDNPPNLRKIKPNQFAIIMVDLSYPLYLLTPLIEEELRKLHPHPKFRRRRDKDQFKLQVYDHIVLNGLTFPDTAKLLKAKVSTVKSAYLTAHRTIHAQVRPLSKMETQQVYSGELQLSGHCATCPVCKKANTEEEMCPLAKAYLQQDYDSQHAYLGYDSAHELSKISAKPERRRRTEESSSRN